MMGNDSAVQSLFNKALLQLLSFLFAGNFPLDALAFLPLVIRRRVFRLLPIMVLHQLKHCHPAATEGVDMGQVWEEVLAERLCPKVNWLAKRRKVRVVVTNRECHYDIILRTSSGSSSPELEVWRVLFLVPFTADLASHGLAKGLKKVQDFLFGKPCKCDKCKQHTFVCSDKYMDSADPFSTYVKEEYLVTYFETLTVLTDVFPVLIDSTLVIDTLAGLVVPPFDVNDPNFLRLFGHVHTLQFSFNVPVNNDDALPLDCAQEFLEALLSSLLARPNLAIQGLHLSTRHRASYTGTAKYRSLVLRLISSFFTSSRSSKTKPFQALKGLRIEVKPAKQEIKRFVSLIKHQDELESLDLVPTLDRCDPTSYTELLEVAGTCFFKPKFRCLTLQGFYVPTCTVLEIESDFLLSTTCEEQELVMEELHVTSSSARKSVSFPSESAACKKSLSLYNCSVSDAGVFSTADLASDMLSHPGTKRLMLSRCLDHVDPYKLAISLEKSAGTLKHLDLSECKLSPIATRAGPLFNTLFSLPCLSQLELVLDDCGLQEEDFKELYDAWERGSSRSSRTRRRKPGDRLKSLSLQGSSNSFPTNTSNLEMMAESVFVWLP